MLCANFLKIIGFLQMTFEEFGDSVEFGFGTFDGYCYYVNSESFV